MPIFGMSSEDVMLEPRRLQYEVVMTFEPRFNLEFSLALHWVLALFYCLDTYSCWLIA